MIDYRNHISLAHHDREKFPTSRSWTDNYLKALVATMQNMLSSEEYTHYMLYFRETPGLDRPRSKEGQFEGKD